MTNGRVHVPEEGAVRAASLPPEEQAWWDADVAALRDQKSREVESPLRMGDLFLAMRARWGGKMPALTEAAGVPYHTARQRAQVAEQIPPGSRIRPMGLPYSILRLLCAVEERERWAEQARALRERGELHVREFARALEEAGARQRRRHRVRQCVGCERALEENARSLFFRWGESAGWLCGPGCAAAYFAGQEQEPPFEIPEDSAGEEGPTVSEPVEAAAN